METLRRALAWEDQQRPGGALQLVIAIILAGLISVTALGFGIAFFLGAGDEVTSEADNPAGPWILLAMGVGVAVGVVVALRRQARRWEAAHGPAEPTMPLRWRPHSAPAPSERSPSLERSRSYSTRVCTPPSPLPWSAWPDLSLPSSGQGAGCGRARPDRRRTPQE